MRKGECSQVSKGVTSDFVFFQTDIHLTGSCKHHNQKSNNPKQDFVFCRMTLSH